MYRTFSIGVLIAASLFVLLRAHNIHKIKSVTRRPGRVSASAASTFSSSEVDELRTVARALPGSWCVQVNPPYGQVSISPVAGAKFSYGCLVVAPDGRAGGTFSRSLWGR